jgi:hypothetical protein
MSALSLSVYVYGWTGAVWLVSLLLCRRRFWGCPRRCALCSRGTRWAWTASLTTRRHSSSAATSAGASPPPASAPAYPPPAPLRAPLLCQASLGARASSFTRAFSPVCVRGHVLRGAEAADVGASSIPWMLPIGGRAEWGSDVPFAHTQAEGWVLLSGIELRLHSKLAHPGWAGTAAVLGQRGTMHNADACLFACVGASVCLSVSLARSFSLVRACVHWRGTGSGGAVHDWAAAAAVRARCADRRRRDLAGRVSLGRARVSHGQPWCRPAY